MGSSEKRPIPSTEPTSDMSSKLITESPSPWLVRLMRMAPKLCLAHTASPSLTAPLPPSTGLLMPLDSVLSLPSSPSPLYQSTQSPLTLRSRSTSPTSSAQQVLLGMNLPEHGFKSYSNLKLL